MSSSSSTIPYLPDELLLNCLARVSRLYYPTLFFVSKRFRSLVTSTEVYETRKLLGCTESCLYMFLLGDPNQRLFTLYRRPTRIPNPNPNPNPNSNKSSGYVMVSVPTHNDFPTPCWDQVAVGSNIYTMLSSGVAFFFDCRSHTWHKAPNMHVSGVYPKVSVLDGKIYVAGGCKDSDPSNFIKCFDPKTQKWELVPIPHAYIPGKYIFKSLAIQENLYLFGNKKNVIYKPKEDKWDAIRSNMFLDRVLSSTCVVDNILYCYGTSKVFEWYDLEERSWGVLKGLEKLPKLPFYLSVKLVNYGGKIAVLWEEDARAIDSSEKKIWCAEITVERRNKHEICGKIEWCDVVHTVPWSCTLLQVIVVTV